MLGDWTCVPRKTKGGAITRASTSYATSRRPPMIVSIGIMRHRTGSPNIQWACVRTKSKVPTPHATSSEFRFPSCPTSKSRTSIDLRGSPSRDFNLRVFFP
jgi:hypothetical protein